MRPSSSRALSLAMALLVSALVACGGDVEPAGADAQPDATTDAPLDATTDAPVDASFTCGDQTCAADQICQSLLVSGGAVVLPDDAGVCPDGMENVGDHCRRLPKYACMPRPASCGASIDCACAESYCLLLSSCPYQCRAASGRTLECVCAVP